MSEPRSLAELTREQLYELVWATPATKLAKEFGVSDVAIFKRCQKLGVPRPERGYWARLAFGKAGEKPPLPPLPDSPAELFAQQALKPMAASVTLSPETESLHPLARNFLSRVKASALSYNKQRVHLREREFPDTEISKTQAPRAAVALHALLNLLEPRGVLFKRSRSKYDGGCFRQGNDDLHLKIEEEMVEKQEAPGRRRSYYSSSLHDNKVPSGRLTFTLNSDRYSRQAEMRWTETEKMSLETIVVEMGKEICRHYADLKKQREAEAIEREKQRIESEIRWKKQQEEEVIRLQEEKKQKHAAALEEAARTRQEDLLKAAEWWRIYRGIEDFITECERRWRTTQAHELSAEQQVWLSWARDVAKDVSPFESGYPVPAKDGGFDPVTILFGGPYPERRKFPQPPTMPKIPPATVVQ